MKVKEKIELTKKSAHHLLSEMMRIRRLEEKSAELYTQLKIRGFLHLYIGEEAVAVGVIDNLKKNDAVFATYREHGHALAKGMSAKAILAELYGKVEGCSHGRGGSMHLFDKNLKFYGGYAIVGGGLPVAAGLALANKMQNSDDIVCTFFGEGAVAEGEFHETMNLSALWDLPILFICENNFYAMGTALNLSESEKDISKKASAYNLKTSFVDGMDIMAVSDAAKNAIDYVRKKQRPYLLECRTYRFRAHSMFDAELYRDKSEVEKWKKRDPISLFKELLESQDLISKKELKKVEDQIENEINEAVEFAENGNWEPEDDLMRFVYSENKEG